MSKHIYWVLLLAGSSYCHNVTIWESNLHDGVRNELVSMFRAAGALVYVLGHKQRRAMGQEILNDNGVSFLPTPALLRQKVLHSMDLLENEMENFYVEVKSTSIMKNTDAFVCSFPMSQCELYMPFNKSIIWLAAHRYSLGRCSADSWNKLDRHLAMTVNATRIATGVIPYSIVAAMNEFDINYINYYTGINPTLFEAIGILYGGARTANYSLERREILLWPADYFQNKKIVEMVSVANTSGFELRTARQMYKRYTFQQLANHRAAILIPYAVHSYGMTELYALGVPLFVPAPEFLYSLKSMVDFQHKADFYCGGRSSPPARHPKSFHELNPESSEKSSFMYWIKYADFYRWPHITYFSSITELTQKLKSADFLAIHNKMILENEFRLQRSQGAYRDLLSKIKVGRQVPSESYKKAIKNLWDV